MSKKNTKGGKVDNNGGAIQQMTDSEKKKKKAEQKAKANPKLAEAKKVKNDACRSKRVEAGSVKSFS